MSDSNNKTDNTTEVGQEQADLHILDAFGDKEPLGWDEVRVSLLQGRVLDAAYLGSKGDVEWMHLQLREQPGSSLEIRPLHAWNKSVQRWQPVNLDLELLLRLPMRISEREWS